jgi:DHA1 family bicyclomycin/chloramphenicol resistance-like MFS transporter
MPERHRLLAIILASLTALGPLGVDIYLPAFPAIGAELQASPAAVQRSLAAFLLGMAVGQLAYGPLSDRVGRRPPIFIGLAVFTLASIGAALAQSVEALTLLRLLQALGGCGGVVVARAVVRDLCDERGAVRMMSLLILAMGAAPILAPALGSWLLSLFGWRAIFWALAIYGAAAMLVVAIFLPESLAPENRRRDGPAQVLSVYASILADRRYLAHLVASALPMCGLFAYLVGSPVILMQLHGLTPGQFGIAFGANAFGLILAAQVVSRLSRRIAPAVLLPRVLVLLSLASLCVPAAVAIGGLLAVLAAFFLYLSILGGVLPLATALAMAPMGRVAGSASALIGTVQFGAGAVIGVALGLVGAESPWPVAVLLGLAGPAGLLLHLALRPASQR